MTIAEKIKAYREKHNITQTEFAEAGNMTRASVEAIENGRIENPGMESLISIAKAMNITLDELIKE